MKRIVLWALMLLLAAGATGCGRTPKDPASAAVSKDYVYKVEELEIQTDMTNFSEIIQGGGRLYACGYEWSENGEETYRKFYEVNEDGSIQAEHQIVQANNGNIGNYNIDQDGNLYCIRNEYIVVDEETGEYRDDYYLVKMTLDGEEFFSVKLNDLPQLKALIEKADYFYMNTLLLSEGKALYAIASGSILQFDLEGNLQKVTELDPSAELENASFVKMENGEFAAILYGETGMSVAAADLETGTVGEKYSIPGASYDFNYYAGIGYDLYMANRNGVYGYNLGDDDKTQLMSYVDSDLNIYNIYDLVAINEKEFWGTYADEATGETVLARFTKVDPADVKEKKTLTLAVGYTDWEVRSQIVDFNKNSEEYRITLLDYSAMYATDADYAAGIAKLNTDIASGNVPDIILLDSSMPVDSYISKGLFEDLKPYIEKDGEIELSNLMPNIVEAYSVNGKLYSLVPHYTIHTLVAKTADVGSEHGWTVREAMDLLASKPEETQFIAEVTRDGMLRYCMNVAADQFIDWDTGKCSFDGEAFIQMLEFINTFPEEIDEEIYSNPAYWENYEAMWREGKAIAAITTLNSFRNFNYTEKGTFGEEITIIGFPTETGDGSAIFPGMRLSMSSKSKNKDGAWEFMRRFLVDEYQDEIEYGFPMSMKRLDELAKEATEKQFYMDEEGNKTEYDDIYTIGGVEIIIDPMTEEEAQKFKAELLTFTACYRENSDLLKIIQEEAAPYFAGQKKAADVAGIIQSRAQIYVSENR